MSITNHTLHIYIPISEHIFCEICNKSLHGKGRHISLKKHLETAHSIYIREFSFKCVGCDRTFSNLRGTAAHTKNCPPPSNVAKIEVISLTDDHISFVLLMPAAPQRCHFEGCTFTSFAKGTLAAPSFQHHLYRKHSLQSSYTWKCLTCGKRLTAGEVRSKSHFRSCMLREIPSDEESESVLPDSSVSTILSNSSQVSDSSDSMPPTPINPVSDDESDSELSVSSVNTIPVNSSHDSDSFESLISNIPMDSSLDSVSSSERESPSNTADYSTITPLSPTIPILTQLSPTPLSLTQLTPSPLSPTPPSPSIPLLTQLSPTPLTQLTPTSLPPTTLSPTSPTPRPMTPLTSAPLTRTVTPLTEQLLTVTPLLSNTELPPTERQANPFLTKWIPELATCNSDNFDGLLRECAADMLMQSSPRLESLPSRSTGSGRSNSRRHQSRQQQRARRPRHHDPKDASFIQKLFNIYPKRAVRQVLKEESPRYSGSLGNLKQFASSLIESSSFATSFPNNPFDGIEWGVPSDEQSLSLTEPPTRKEIVRKLSKVSNTAPGHDGLEYRHIKKCDPSGKLLEAIFKVVHELGIPKNWKVGKTVLIHKKGCLEDAFNFRPITLLCTLYKLYSSILASKLVKVATDLKWISQEQKGFIPGLKGIQEHTYLLESCVGEARKNHKPLFMAWLDLRNAFGSLPHTILKSLFTSLPIPHSLQTTLLDIYSGTKCSLVGGQHKIDVSPTAGVRQGDGLSPIIFNLATEPLIRLIKSINDGFNLNGQMIKTTTYADDTAIISDNSASLQVCLNKLQAVSSSLGLQFNPTKCKSISIVNNQVFHTPFSINNTPIPSLKKDEFEVYLGIPIGHKYLFGLSSDIPNQLTSVAESLLAPWQKLEVLRTHLLPSMSFQLSSGRVKKDQLADLDNLVAKFLKYICKLPERASNTFLYASRNVGGLAIQKCSEEADIWTSAKGIQLLDSDDLTIRHLARIKLDNTISTGLKGRNACHLKFLSGSNDDGLFTFRHNSTLSNLWTRVRKAVTRLHCKIDADEQNYLLIIDDVSCFASKITKSIRLALRERWSAKLKNLSVQGRVARAFSLDVRSNDIPYLISQRTRISFNAWSYWHKSKLCCLPVKFIPGTTSNDDQCRRCGDTLETTSHVVSNCRIMYREMTTRHDSVELILTSLLDNFNIAYSYKYNINNLIPDILITSPTRLVIDITCPFD